MSTESSTAQQTALETPKMYEVVLLNDDFTPMDFVVTVLEEIFGLASPQAHVVMWHVHKHGSAPAGAYTKEIAESKVAQAHRAAEHFGHPLRCEIRRQA